MPNGIQAFAEAIVRALEAAERTVDTLQPDLELPPVRAHGKWRSHRADLEGPVDLHDGEEAEVPGGPIDAEFASDMGLTKALLKKTLKKLEADGLVEKLSVRTARYLVIGGDE